MTGKDVRISASDGREFGGYLVTPDSQERVPAIVLASAIHGVDADLRAIADEFASHGFLAIAPDLFWRTTAGPLGRDDPRASARGQPRLERIKAGEQDLVDALAFVRKQPSFNGNAAVIGFCYGGPYAVLGPKRLGFEAGISCHGSQMMDYLAELEGLRQPICIVWGDKDTAAPEPVLTAYRDRAARMGNLEVDVLPGVAHGFMMKGARAYDAAASGFAMQRALSILRDLR